MPGASNMRIFSKEEENSYYNLLPNKLDWKYKHHFNAYGIMSSFYEDDYFSVCCEETEFVLVDIKKPIDLTIRNVIFKIHDSFIDAFLIKVFFNQYFTNGSTKYILENGL